MLMVLENDTMNLIDPLGQTLLHAQPIHSIRVWGVGRDNGRSVCHLPCHATSTVPDHCSVSVSVSARYGRHSHIVWHYSITSNETITSSYIYTYLRNITYDLVCYYANGFTSPN